MIIYRAVHNGGTLETYYIVIEEQWTSDISPSLLITKYADVDLTVGFIEWMLLYTSISNWICIWIGILSYIFIYPSNFFRIFDSFWKLLCYSYISVPFLVLHLGSLMETNIYLIAGISQYGYIISLTLGDVAVFGRCSSIFKYVIFRHFTVIDIWNNFCEIALS